MLNKYLSEKRRTLAKLNTEAFYEHFRKLSQYPFKFFNPFESFTDKLDIHNLSSNNNILNAEFTVDEIKKVIRKLKIIKAPQCLTIY